MTYQRAPKNRIYARQQDRGETLKSAVREELCLLRGRALKTGRPEMFSLCHISITNCCHWFSWFPHCNYSKMS